jgi:hypothetical protein
MSPLEDTTMNCRTIGLLILAMVLAPLVAFAQSLGKVPRIGLLAIGFAPSTPEESV